MIQSYSPVDIQSIISQRYPIQFSKLSKLNLLSEKCKTVISISRVCLVKSRDLTKCELRVPVIKSTCYQMLAIPMLQKRKCRNRCSWYKILHPALKKNSYLEKIITCWLG